MDDDISLSEFNAVGRMFVYQQSLGIQIAVFLTSDSSPILVSSYYGNNELDNSIPPSESFMDIFGFRLFENGDTSENHYVFSNKTKTELYPIIQIAISDVVTHLKSKLGHYPFINQNVISDSPDFGLMKFNVWGRLFIDPITPGIGVELASQLDNGSIIYSFKGYQSEDHHFQVNQPTYYEVASVLESGKYPVVYLIAPDIEDKSDLELCRIVIYSAIEDLRDQVGYYTVSEENKRSNEYNSSKLN